MPIFLLSFLTTTALAQEDHQADSHSPKFLGKCLVAADGGISMNVANANYHPCDWLEIFENEIAYLSDLFFVRVEKVQSAVKVCKKQSCKPQSIEYDQWSTDELDQEIVSSIERIERAMDSLRQDYIHIEKEFSARMRESRYPVGEKWLTGEEVVYLFRVADISSNPNDPEMYRWGLASKNSN